LILPTAAVHILPIGEVQEGSVSLHKSVVKHPVSGDSLKLYGTDVLINILNEAGDAEPGTFATVDSRVLTK